jgi:hypothetical protein
LVVRQKQVLYLRLSLRIVYPRPCSPPTGPAPSAPGSAPTPFQRAEGNTDECEIASIELIGLCAVEDPWHAWKLHPREPGGPIGARHAVVRGPVGESLVPLCCFAHTAQAAQRVTPALCLRRGRLGRFGLELHPDKTRLIEFGRYAVANRKERGEGKPETFNFLGFSVLQKAHGKEFNHELINRVDKLRER